MKSNRLSSLLAFSLAVSCAIVPTLRADEANVEIESPQAGVSFSGIASSIGSQVKDGAFLCLQHLPIKIASMVLMSVIASRDSQIKNDTKDVYDEIRENVTPRLVLFASLAIPVLEELGFTILPDLLQKEYAQYVQPILFALGHKHDNKYKWLVHGLTAGTMNLLHHRYLHKKPRHYLAPIISHMIPNAIIFSSWLALKKLVAYYDNSNSEITGVQIQLQEQ